MRYATESSIHSATKNATCARYKVVVVSKELELDAAEVPIPTDCQTVEVFTPNEHSAIATVTALFAGYKVMDCWQAIEEECPF